MLFCVISCCVCGLVDLLFVGCVLVVVVFGYVVAFCGCLCLGVCCFGWVCVGLVCWLMLVVGLF